MSYSKPRQMKTGVLELNKTLLDQSLKRSSQREAVKQKRTSENLSALTNVATSLAAQAIAPKADGLAELNKDYAKATKKLYKKISSTDYDTGFEGLDKKQDVFMNGVIKDYYSIKTNMNNQVDPSLAMQDLANIENMIDEYGTGVVNMIGFNKAIEEASKADLNSGGKLSNAGAPSSQLQIIRKVSGGGKEAEDIEIKREGNNIILYDIKTDTSLNITEFNAAQSRNEEYLVYAKPTEDITTEFFGNRIKNENDEDVYNTNFVTKNSDNTYSMTPQQQIDYKNGSMAIEVDSNGKELMSMGGDFEGLLFGGENIAESIWEDQMFEDPNFKVESQWPTGDQEIAIPFGDKFIKTELSSDEIINNAKKANATKEDKELYEAFYKTYYKPSLNFLAEQSLKNGSSSMQITLDQPPEEDNAAEVDTPEAKAELPNTVVQPSEAVVVEEVDEAVVDKEGVNKTLKIDVGDGNDYIRKMFNYENTSGNSSGGGVKDYGFTGQGDKGAALKKLYGEAEGTPDEKGIKVVNEYIIGTSPGQEAGDYGTTILADLGMDRKTYEELPENIKEQLVDWKFNTGRGSADLIAIASGIEIDGEEWDGTKAFDDPSPTPDKIKDVDYSKLTPGDLYDARMELYKKRVEGMEKMLKKDPDNEKLKADLKFAKDGYNNSHINRLKVDTKEESAEELVSNLQTANSVEEISGGPGYIPSINYASNK